MSAASVRGGRAYVEVGADLNPLEANLKRIEAKFKAFGSRLTSIGSSVAKVGAGVSALGAGILAPITAAVHKFTAAGDALDKMSARTGVGVEALAELGFAAEQGGTNIESVEKGFNGLSRTLFDAALGSKTAAESLDAIGLSYKQLEGLKPDEQFQMVADALSNVTDESQKGAIAQRIFGKAGRQLLPMLSTLREVRQEARDLGLTLKKTDTDNAAKLADAFNRIKRTTSGAFLQIGAAVAEPLLKALNVITQITARINHWVANNHKLVQTVAAIGLGLLAVGSLVTVAGVAFIGLGATISAIGTVIGSVVGIATAAFSAVAGAVAFLLSPIGLVAAAVVGLGGYMVYTALTATNSLSVLSSMFGSLGETATTAWGGIVAAISTGDLETAGQIAFTALEIGWLTITNTMQDVWNRVSDFFVNTWLSAVESIVQTGASIYFGIAKYFDQLSNALVAGFDVAFTYITGAIDTIQTAIAKAIIKAQTFFGLFSAEQSVQIQASLDSDLERRANGRQTGLDGRANERGAALDERDGQRRATAEQFSEIVSQDFARRQSKTDNSGLTAAQAKLEELKLSLTLKATEAQEKAAKAQSDSEAATGAQAAQDAATAATQTTGAGSVGTFVAGVANSIAGGGASPLEDLNKQQLGMLESIDDRLRENNEALEAA